MSDPRSYGAYGFGADAPKGPNPLGECTPENWRKDSAAIAGAGYP